MSTLTVTENKSKSKLLPQYKVLIHNDPINSMQHVVSSIQEVFKYTVEQATAIMMEAHKTGVGLCKVEPLERAELHKEQLETFKLTASIEPA